MMVPTAFICFYSCEKHKSDCGTAVNTAYIACAETEEANSQTSQGILHFSSLSSSGKTVIRMKITAEKTVLPQCQLSDMYQMFQTYQTGR